MHRWSSRDALGWPFVLILAAATGASASEAGPPGEASGVTWVRVREGMASQNAAAASPSTYVLAGKFGDIWSSSDGASWTRRVTPAEVRVAVNGAVYAGGQFVLVGDTRCCAAPDASAIVLTSPDGVDWTLRSSAPAGTQRVLNAVAYGGSSYVAVGNQGLLLTSLGADVWTARATGTTQHLRGIAFGAGAFVAVGSNRTVLRSTDGITWSAPTVPATTGLEYRAVTHTGSQFVVVGDVGAILTSPDGTSWTERSLPPNPGLPPPPPPSLLSVSSGGGLIVAGDGPQVFSSPDGVTWTSRGLHWSGGETNPYVFAIAYGGSGFVATGEHGTLHSSTDGLVWTHRTLAASRYLTAAAQGNGVFCAVGFGGAVVSSPDGIAWTNRTGLTVPDDTRPYFWYSLVFSSTWNRFIAVGQGPTVMTSPDCVTWTGHAAGSGPRGHFGVAEGGGIVVAVGAKSPDGVLPQSLPVIATSGDGGTSWTVRDPVGGTGVLQTVAFRNESSPGAADPLFVAVGGDDASATARVFTSPDGTTWAPRTPTGLGPALGPPNVTYGKGIFLLTYGAHLWTSPDGVNWTERTGPTETPYGVLYADGQFLAVGHNGSVSLSSDAVSWVTHDSATGHNLFAATHGAPPARFAAVGESAITYYDVPVSAAQISIGNASVAEGDVGTVPATFTVNLSGSFSLPVAVDYATSGGTATSATDFIASEGTLVFPPGTTTRTISVPVLGDRLNEGGETFSVNLKNPVNATLANAQGIGTIVDDDPVGFAVSDVGLAEPRTGAANATFTVTLSPAAGGTVSVGFATADGSATAPADYTTSAATLTFAAGQSSQTISVPVKADAVAEATEVFYVDLQGSSGPAIARSRGTATIHDPGLYSLTPCRLLDTRESNQGPALSAGSTRTVVVGGRCGVPTAATAVTLNVTVVSPTGDGDLRIFPAGLGIPLVSTINYRGGQTRANNATATLNAAGMLSVYCEQTTGIVDLVVDVNGYLE